MAIEHIFDQIGGFSRFQVLFVVWVYSFKFMMAWSTMLLSFASFKNDHACIIDSVFNQSTSENIDEPAVWATANRGFNNNTLINACEVGGITCQGFYFFGTKRTIISEWSLVCDLRWMKATITSIQFGGVLTGAVIGGQSGDYFGRKKTLYGSYLLHTILNVVAAYSFSWQMFTAMRFFIGVMIGVVLVMIVPYSTEFFPIQWRHIIPALPMWPLGVCAFALAAWILEDWAELHLACAILGIPGLLGFFYIPESSRWLATQGRELEAYDTLKKMAKLNRKELPSTAEETIKKIATEEKTTGKGKDYSYHDLFKNADSTKITIIAGFQWFVLSMVFYGLSFAVTSFAGNLYLNIFLMSIVSIPANFISFLLIDRIGRRWTCLVFLSVAVVVSFVCVGLHLKAPKHVAETLISYICLVAKLAVAACWTASQTWVTESYPTVTRSLGYGFSNMTSRVGAIIAPFVINLDEMPLLTFVLMGIMGSLSMVLTYFWPETQNKTMAETVFERKGMTSDLEDKNNIDLEINSADISPYTISNVEKGDTDVAFLSRRRDGRSVSKSSTPERPLSPTLPSITQPDPAPTLEELDTPPTIDELRKATKSLATFRVALNNVKKIARKCANILAGSTCATAFNSLRAVRHQDFSSHGGSFSEYFPIKDGVKQERFLAPTIFGLSISLLLRFAFRESENGIFFHVKNDGYLFNLARLRAKTKVRRVLITELSFPDDAALICHIEEALQRSITRFAKAYNAFGLTISLKKTHITGQDVSDTPYITIDHHALEAVDNLTTLAAASSVTYPWILSTMASLAKRVWGNPLLTINRKVADYAGSARMDDGRLPKDIMGGGLATVTRPTGRPILRTKDFCKRDLKTGGISLGNLESSTADRTLW
ncbi:hypothetical protein RRG08_006197 [Elysia crispata]|uniref:Major facilitator superfamily (MFS) profile domain-containing protein n=1 Tax=Elysia crispata TaxID=231223 RepID=A0AAE1A417_9GAST|nr:hypothetical protein RRG08_006197 [Elysia crispata]